MRELINCRNHVIGKRTRAKCAIRSLLRSAGVTPPRHAGLWTKQGAAWLRELELPTISHQLRRDLLLEEIDTLNGQLRRIEQELTQRALQTPAVRLLRASPVLVYGPRKQLLRLWMIRTAFRTQRP